MYTILQSISMRFVLALSLLLSLNTSAGVFEQLVSNDLAQLKIASQTIYAGREASQENTDILAEILLSKYQNAQTTEIDTLAWACKALAATNNGRYRNLLVKISQSDAHKKLRKYAIISYKKLPEGAESYKKGTVDLAAVQTIGAKSTSKILLPKANLNQVERKLFVIAKGDLGAIKKMAQDMYANKSENENVIDALTEFLLAHYKDAAEYQADTLAWICRAMGELNNGRYTQAMELVSEGSNHSKIRRHASKSYNKLPKAENTYAKGSMNFEELINQYKAN